jgi:hypothetical protein
MQLHHLALSAILAEQHRDELCHQAKQARLARASRGVRAPREATMSRRARAIILGVTLAAISLAGLTTVAHAQASDPTTATAGPALSWKDDYGTRHHVIPVQDELGG